LRNEQKIFAYCERGTDPSFWAEPLNAVTNLGFILAFAYCVGALANRPKGEHGPWMHFLVWTVLAIGVGSFLFHTLATPRAALADVIPIGVFMLAYFGYALRRFLQFNMVVTLAGVFGFAALINLAQSLRCHRGRIGFLTDVPAFENTACLNGSLGYVPAFLAMAVIGAVLALKSHPAARYVLAAAGIFAVSLTFRTFDRAWCEIFTLEGVRIGTHFLWHILNSLTLFILLLAAIRHGHHYGRLRH